VSWKNWQRVARMRRLVRPSHFYSRSFQPWLIRVHFPPLVLVAFMGRLGGVA
jgi:hypothetical protein